MKLKISVAALVASALLAGCSTSQIKLQNDLVYANENRTEFVLKDFVEVEALHAKPLTLKANTRWYKVGTIDRGVVYGTYDQVVIVNSFNVYEGYIVINEGNVVGYYLPTEKTFVETKPVTINFVHQ